MVIKRTEKELMEIAQQIIDNTIHPIEGCRLINKLRFKTANPSDEVFLPIIGIESETDEFVLGNTRSNADSTYLKEKDTELERYLLELKPVLIRTCEQLIRKFSES
jgi:hypothetical protein